MVKWLTLFFSASIIVVFVYYLPFYHSWTDAKLFCESCTISAQSQDLKEDDRMAIRFGGPYNACMSVKNMIESNHFTDPIVLIPPDNYLILMHNETGIYFPEPAVFYYFTGIPAVLVTSPNAHRANVAVIVQNKKFFLKIIRSQEQNDSIIAQMKKYL